MSKQRTANKKGKQAKINPYEKKKQQKSLPWLWIALATVCCAALIAAGVWIFGRGGDADASSASAGTQYIAIDVANYGTITAELYSDVAPVTVANFVKLVKEGFYDGLTFHRIMTGFMIQGGDPLGNGTGGSSQTIKGEFAKNGVANALKHTRGVLSMARSSAYNSASSQFFIMHADSPSLDGLYAAFGKVTGGMDIVDAICDSTPVTDNNGTVLKENQPVITSIRMVSAPQG